MAKQLQQLNDQNSAKSGGSTSPSVTTAYSDNSSLSKAGGVAYAYGWSSLLVPALMSVLGELLHGVVAAAFTAGDETAA